MALAQEGGDSPPQVTPQVTAEDTQPEELVKGGSIELGLSFDRYEALKAEARLGHGSLLDIPGLELDLLAVVSNFRRDAEVSLGGTTALHGPLFWRVSGYHKTGRLRADSKFYEQRIGGQGLVGLELSPSLSLSLGSRHEQRDLNHAQLLEQAPGGLAAMAQDPSRTMNTVFLEATWDHLEEPLDFFLEGWEVKGRLEHSGGLLSSDYDFTSANVELRYGTALPRGMRLQLQSRAGFTHSQSSTDIPLLERHRLGSPYNIGGVATGPLGSAVEGEDGLILLGGDAGAYGRVTLYVPLWEEQSLYAFAALEGGVVRDDLLEQPAFRAGAAGILGATWISPLASLTLGYSAPLQRDDAPWGEPPTIFFNSGTRF
jgi:outer membrane protein assembly factor BamA